MDFTESDRIASYQTALALVRRLERLEERMDTAELVSTDTADDVERILRARSRRSRRRASRLAAAGLVAVSFAVLASGASDALAVFFIMSALLVLQSSET